MPSSSSIRSSVAVDSVGLGWRLLLAASLTAVLAFYYVFQLIRSLIIRRHQPDDAQPAHKQPIENHAGKKPSKQADASESEQVLAQNHQEHENHHDDQRIPPPQHHSPKIKMQQPAPSQLTRFRSHHGEISENVLVKTIAFLHIAPVPGELRENTRLVRRAMRQAAGAGAEWILTPELAVSGYHFDDKIGTNWIQPAGDQWIVAQLRRLANELGVVLFLGHADRDEQQQPCLHNTLFVINRNGAILGQHHKINTIPGSEAWSTPGSPPPRAVQVDDGDHGGDNNKLLVGLLICADAFDPANTAALKQQGAQVIVSAATWPPGPYGPGDCWRQRSRETGLTLFCCNRTGQEASLDCRRAVSVVAHRGKHIVEHASSDSSVLMVTWNFTSQTLVDHSSFSVK